MAKAIKASRKQLEQMILKSSLVAPVMVFPELMKPTKKVAKEEKR